MSRSHNRVLLETIKMHAETLMQLPEEWLNEDISSRLGELDYKLTCLVEDLRWRLTGPNSDPNIADVDILLYDAIGERCRKQGTMENQTIHKEN